MFFTQNPIGSSATEDLQDNAISFDYAMNSPAALWQDRFGKQHKTVQQALKDVGFKPAGFDFVSGGTLGIGDRDKCVFYPTDGYWYSWNGKLPYVVPANSSPTPGGKKGWGIVTRDERVITREALRRTYLEAGYNLVEGSFEQGGVLNNQNDVLLYEATGVAYSWLGDLPRAVPPTSSPATTGGISPSGDWVDIGDASLRTDLSGGGGFSKVAFNPANVLTGDGRTLEDWLRDGLAANVKWWGAKGDWNPGPAQTGTDDTEAVQAAIDYLATLGSRRNGAVRKLYFPQGNYRLSAITIPVGIGFGLSIYGDGQFASQLFFDPSDPSPAFDCEIESLDFHGLGMFGSLSDSAAVAGPAAWKSVGFKGKNSYNIPDIDVKFSECGILFWKEFSQIYGRGVVFDNCTIGEIGNLLNIVCDPSTTFVAGDALRSVETGMRNYVIRNCRTDQVRETLVKVTGTGPQKEYINGLAIRGNDLVATVKLIAAPDATLRRLSIGDNTGLYSFRFGVVHAKGIYSVNMHDCNFSRRFEETVEPTGFNDCIPFLINASEQLHDVDVDHVVVRNLSGNLVATVGSASKVSIKNITAPNAWIYRESGSSITYIFYAPGNCPGLQIDGNQFSSTVTSLVYRAFNPAAQTDKNTFVGVNPAPWNWADSRLEYTPSLLVNGIATSVTPSSRSGRYHYDGKYVHVEVMLIVAMTETTGELAISLPPITAIAENLGITGSYAGGGEVNNYLGFSVPGSVFSRITVNPTTQRAELWRENGMGRTQVGAGDKTGAISLYVSFKYRA